MFPTPMASSPRTSVPPKNQSVNNQSNPQSNTQSSTQSNTHSNNQSNNQSNSQSTNLSNSHSANPMSRQTSDQSTNQPANHTVNQMSRQTSDQSVSQLSRQTSDQSTSQVPPLYPNTSKLSSLSDRIKGRIAKYRHKEDQIAQSAYQSISHLNTQSNAQPNSHSNNNSTAQSGSESQSSVQSNMVSQSTNPSASQLTNQMSVSQSTVNPQISISQPSPVTKPARSFSLSHSPGTTSANNSPLSNEPSQSINQSINQIIKNTSVNPPTAQAVNQITSQKVNSGNMSAKQPKLPSSASNPSTLLSSQSSDKLNNLSINQSTNQSANQSITKTSISLLSPPHLKHSSPQPTSPLSTQSSPPLAQSQSQVGVSNFSVARPVTPPRAASPAVNQSANKPTNLSVNVSNNAIKTSPSNLSIKQLMYQSNNPNVRTIVGSLHVRIVEARNLNHQSISQSKMRSYLFCEFEDLAYQSTTQAGISPFFGFEFNCPVTDSCADLVIAVVEVNKLKKNSEIGSIVMSLTSLTQGDWHPNARYFVLDEWIELLPSNYDHGPNGLFERKWPSNEHRITGAGMRKPARWPIGQLHVKCELTLNFPLIVCYGLNPPIPARKPKPKSSKKGDQSTNQSANAEDHELLPSPISIEQTTDNNTDQSINLSPTLSDMGRATSPIPPLSINQSKPATPLPIKPPANMTNAPPAPPEFHGPTFKRNFRRLQRFYATPAYWFHYARLIRTWHSPLTTVASMIFIYSMCFRTQAHHWPLVICFLIFLIGFASFHQSSQDLSNILTFDTEAIPSEYLKEGALNKFRRWRGVLGRASYSLGRVASFLESTSQAFNFTDFHLSLSIYSIMFLFASFVSTLFYFLRPGLVFFTIISVMVIDGLIDALKRWEIEHQTADRIEAQNKNIELSRKRAELMALHQLNTQSVHSSTSQSVRHRPNSPKAHDDDSSPSNHLNTSNKPSANQSSQSTPSSPLIKYSPSVGPSTNIISVNQPANQSKRGFFAALRQRARPGLAASIAQQSNLTINQPATESVDDFVLISSPTHIRTRSRSDSDGRLADLPLQSSHSPRQPTLQPVSPPINSSTSQSATLFNRSVTDFPFLNGNLQQMIEQREQQLLDQSINQSSDPSIPRPNRKYVIHLVLSLFTCIHVWYRQYAWIAQLVSQCIKLVQSFLVNLLRRAPDQLELAHRIIGNRAMHSRINQTINQSIYAHELAQHQLYQNLTSNQSTSQSATQSSNRVSGAIAQAYQKLNQRRNANKQTDQTIHPPVTPSHSSTSRQPAGVWHAPSTHSTHQPSHQPINPSSDILIHSEYLRARADSGASSQDHRWETDDDSDSGLSSESESD